MFSPKCLRSWVGVASRSVALRCGARLSSTRSLAAAALSVLGEQTQKEVRRTDRAEWAGAESGGCRSSPASGWNLYLQAY
eukprot:27008-Amphidinium_carterae.1